MPASAAMACARLMNGYTAAFPILKVEATWPAPEGHHFAGIFLVSST
jgi:hypothetical protein